MLETKAILEEEPKLKLIVDNTQTGDKLPPGSNWLGDRELGEVFLCKEKNTNNFMMYQFLVKEKPEEGITYLVGEGGIGIYVDNVRFCLKFTYGTSIASFSTTEDIKED